MKTCFKCDRTLPLTEFYRHPRMADGHVGKCKACARADVSAYAQENPDVIRKRKLDYSRTEAGKAVLRRSYAKRKVKHPDRLKVNGIVGNAMKLGKLTPLPCFVCGAAKTEGHHADYSRPLDVVWLCKKHHVEVHQLAKQLNRKEASQ